jgi:hypothetical protein
VFQETTTAAPRGATSTTTSSAVDAGIAVTAGSDVAASDGDGTTPTTDATAIESTSGDSIASSLPAGTPQQDPFGVVPPRDVTC